MHCPPFSCLRALPVMYQPLTNFQTGQLEINPWPRYSAAMRALHGSVKFLPRLLCYLLLMNIFINNNEHINDCKPKGLCRKPRELQMSTPGELLKPIYKLCLLQIKRWHILINNEWMTETVTVFTKNNFISLQNLLCLQCPYHGGFSSPIPCWQH